MNSAYKRDKDGKLLLTKEEALEIRDDYARGRDFWVYDMEANRELLQAALDFLQNSIEGNYYYVTYMDSQNGSRLVVHCDPCNKSLSSYDPFMSHDAGKAHKKAVSQNINKKISEKARKEIKFQPLNTPKGIFEHDSLEDMLDQCEERVLGLQFLFKERLYGPDSSYRFSCQLCRVNRVRKSEMFEHLTATSTHNQKYLMAKFNRRITSMEAFENKCKEVEELEGKVNHNIIDFTQQFEVLRKACGGATPPPAASPPPSPTRASSPPQEKRPVSPPPALVSNKEIQVDPDELDQELDLTKEVALIRLNDGDQKLSEDVEAVELLMQTLESLNMKMHDYYKRRGSACVKFTGKYHKYLTGVHDCLKEVMDK